MAERPNSSRLTVLFRLWALGLPGRLIEMKQLQQGRPVKTRLARSHITDLVISEATMEVATSHVNAIAELLFTRDIELR